jgi:uncharacterized membrane protein YfcA
MNSGISIFSYWWLLPVGLVVGVFGTLIGAGGGFILAPLLLLLYPGESPAIITCISLAVVFFNAASGSVAYARMKRIDYRTGLLFSLATVPGAILGAVTTNYIPRREFDLVFGGLLVMISVFLVLRPRRANGEVPKDSHGRTTRHLIEADGTAHTYSFNPALGLSLSAAVGYLSSLLGTGGGIIHVPAMIRLLNFPVHVATATSHFILAIMALTGTIVHVASGTFQHGMRRTIVLSIGVLVGAQIGALLSSRVKGDWIVRLLGASLALVGLRILGLAL